ncbi:Hypothetical protein DHA2_16985 [Giardia duodenalis]|uniref:Uncharacterized protein n=1 Tax=Giardia intestinalis TaxID=5741 RepID=V6TEW1_GIAIN|nr:Hypothetical protein DHA2_16985 [Giardia intestinalis]
MRHWHRVKFGKFQKKENSCGSMDNPRASASLMDEVTALRKRVVDLQVQSLGSSFTQEEITSIEDGIRFDAAQLLHRLFPYQSVKQHYNGSTICGDSGRFQANIAFITRLRAAILNAAEIQQAVKNGSFDRAESDLEGLGRLSPPEIDTKRYSCDSDDDRRSRSAKQKAQTLHVTISESEQELLRLQAEYASLNVVRQERDDYEEQELLQVEEALVAITRNSESALQQVMVSLAYAHALIEFTSLSSETKTEYIKLASACDSEVRKAVLGAEMSAVSDHVPDGKALASKVELVRTGLIKLFGEDVVDQGFTDLLAIQRERVIDAIADSVDNVLEAVMETWPRSHAKRETNTANAFESYDIPQDPGSLTTSDLKAPNMSRTVAADEVVAKPYVPETCKVRYPRLPIPSGDVGETDSVLSICVDEQNLRKQGPGSKKSDHSEAKACSTLESGSHVPEVSNISVLKPTDSPRLQIERAERERVTIYTKLRETITQRIEKGARQTTPPDASPIEGPSVLSAIRNRASAPSTPGTQLEDVKNTTKVSHPPRHDSVDELISTVNKHMQRLESLTSSNTFSAVPAVQSPEIEVLFSRPQLDRISIDRRVSSTSHVSPEQLQADTPLRDTSELENVTEDYTFSQLQANDNDNDNNDEETSNNSKSYPTLTFDTAYDQDSLPQFLRGEDSSQKSIIAEKEETILRREEMRKQLEALYRQRELILQQKKQKTQQKETKKIDYRSERKLTPDITATEAKRKASQERIDKLATPRRRFDTPKRDEKNDEQSSQSSTTIAQSTRTPQKRTTSARSCTRETPKRDKQHVSFNSNSHTEVRESTSKPSGISVGAYPSSIYLEETDELDVDSQSMTRPARSRPDSGGKSRLPRPILTDDLSLAAHNPRPPLPSYLESPPTVDLPGSKHSASTRTHSRHQTRSTTPPSTMPLSATYNFEHSGSYMPLRRERTLPHSSVIHPVIGPILSPLRSKILSETQFEIERKKAIRRRKEYERKEKERRAGETTVKEELLKQRDQRIRDFVKRMEGGNFQEKTFKKLLDKRSTGATSGQSGSLDQTTRARSKNRFDAEEEEQAAKRNNIDDRLARASEAGYDCMDDGLKSILSDIEHDLFD